MGPIIFFLSMALAIVYVFIITYFSNAWDDTPEWKIPDNYLPKTKVAVIIPIRNEATNIPGLLKDLLGNRYPKDLLEIWVIDDDSTDNISDAIQPFLESITYERLINKPFGKKAALTHGINKSTADLIVCIDGDCHVGPKHLQAIASYFEYQKVDFTTSFVTTTYKIGMLEAMQNMDLAGTMLIGAAGIKRKNIFLANGANMAFNKNQFIEAGGFEGNAEVASGDDIFLIQKFASTSPDKVKFLKCKDCIVSTQPEKTIRDLLQQRKRWATKTRYYKNELLVKLQSYVAIVQIWILLCFIASSWTGGISFFSGLFLLFIKWTMDYLLVAKVSRFYNNTRPLKYFIPGAFLQFIIYGYAAYSALLIKSYWWKGRKVN